MLVSGALNVMLLVSAQLHCAVEMTELPIDDDGLEGAALQSAGAVPHVFEYQNALTGEALTPSEVSALAPRAIDSEGEELPTRAPIEVDASRLRFRQALVLGARGNYTLRVDGSRRYYGCAETFRREGPAARRVLFSLLPRARDLAVTVEVTRDANTAGVPERGLATLELRADASAERDVEIHRGTCSGERAASGRFWCAQMLNPAAQTITLAARFEGLGTTRVSVDPGSTERTIAVVARFAGHLMPTVTLRAQGSIGVVNGDGAGFVGAVDVLPSGPRTGRACAIGDLCLRPVVHVGGAYTPYRRETVMLGPGELRTQDSAISGTLGVFELGAGLLVVPPGTADRFRAMVLGSALLASHRDEHDAAHPALLMSSSSTRVGFSTELTLGFRLFEGVVFNAGARVTLVPSIGAAGRQFSYLGDAAVSSATASLLHLGLQLGLGIEL